MLLIYYAINFNINGYVIMALLADCVDSGIVSSMGVNPYAAGG